VAMQELPLPRTKLEAWERRTAVPMLILALVATVVLVAELVVPDLSPTTLRTFEYVDWAITAAFAAEYLWRLFGLARDRWRFFRTHLFDLLIIVVLPLRIVRSVRILRSTRMVRAGLFVGKGAHESKDLVTLKAVPRVLLISGVIVVASAALVWGIETQESEASIQTFEDALWWAMTTAMSVGSTFEPITPEGRVIAVGLMVMGISVIAALAGIFASDFLLRRNEDAEIVARLDRLDQAMERVDRAEGAPPSRPGEAD
jgi:Ion transport protein